MIPSICILSAYNAPYAYDYTAGARHRAVARYRARAITDIMPVAAARGAVKAKAGACACSWVRDYRWARASTA